MAKEVIGLDIIAMRKACEVMEPYKRGDCPNCNWPLRISVDDITECLCCGWQDSYPVKRDIERV